MNNKNPNHEHIYFFASNFTIGWKSIYGEKIDNKTTLLDVYRYPQGQFMCTYCPRCGEKLGKPPYYENNNEKKA